MHRIIFLHPFAVEGPSLVDHVLRTLKPEQHLLFLIDWNLSNVGMTANKIKAKCSIGGSNSSLQYLKDPRVRVQLYFVLLRD